MTEPIHWQELTPQQRDELIHEKVMNLPIETGLCQHRFGSFAVTCPVCQSTWTENETERPHQHGKGVPPYTQSRDAAWAVLLSTPFTSRSGRYSSLAAFVHELFDIDMETPHDIDPFWALGIVSGWTPEIICIAALRVCGMKVVTK
jgi:hypothetical protein